MPLADINDPLYWYDWELHEVINDLKDCIRHDLAVPIDIYTKLEDFGIEIDKLTRELEQQIHGESEFENTYWGC
jgi:hypothetical protein